MAVRYTYAFTGVIMIWRTVILAIKTYGKRICHRQWEVRHFKEISWDGTTEHPATDLVSVNDIITAV